MVNELLFPTRGVSYLSICHAIGHASTPEFAGDALGGGPALVCTWGRIGGPGRSLARVLRSHEEAEQVLYEGGRQVIAKGLDLPRVTLTPGGRVADQSRSVIYPTKIAALWAKRRA